jgi:predicted HTH transcriptional regulator
MKITRVVKQAEDGTYSAVLILDEEQMRFLLQFAIGFLAQQGTISVFDVKEGEPMPEETDSATEFLRNLDTTKLPQA